MSSLDRIEGTRVYYYPLGSREPGLVFARQDSHIRQ